MDSKARLIDSPPVYPVRAFPLPRTRWQGIIIEIGLAPTADPMAWAPLGIGELNTRWLSSP